MPGCFPPSWRSQKAPRHHTIASVAVVDISKTALRALPEMLLHPSLSPARAGPHHAPNNSKEKSGSFELAECPALDSHPGEHLPLVLATASPGQHLPESALPQQAGSTGTKPLHMPLRGLTPAEAASASSRSSQGVALPHIRAPLLFLRSHCCALA